MLSGIKLSKYIKNSGIFLTLLVASLSLEGCKKKESSLSSDSCYIAIPNSHISAISIYGAEESEMSFHLAIPKPLSSSLEKDLQKNLVLFASQNGDFRNILNLRKEQLPDVGYLLKGNLGELSIALEIPLTASNARPTLRLNGKEYSKNILSYGTNYQSASNGIPNGPLNGVGIVCPLSGGLSLAGGLQSSCVGRSLQIPTAQLASIRMKRNLFGRQRNVIGKLPIQSPASLSESLHSAPTLRGPTALSLSLIHI